MSKPPQSRLSFYLNLPTCAVPLMYSFLILSNLVTPNGNCSILSSTTSSSIYYFLVSATVSRPIQHSWSHYCLIRCQACLHFLRQPKKFGFCHTIFARFYHSVIESILCFGISVRFGATASRDKARLECIVRQASHIGGCNFSSIASLYDTQLCRRAGKISVGSCHPANHLFELLPSSRSYRAIEAKTHWCRLRFLPEAIWVMQPVSSVV